MHRLRACLSASSGSRLGVSDCGALCDGFWVAVAGASGVSYGVASGFAVSYAFVLLRFSLAGCYFLARERWCQICSSHHSALHLCVGSLQQGFGRSRVAIQYFHVARVCMCSQCGSRRIFFHGVGWMRRRGVPAEQSAAVAGSKKPREHLLRDAVSERASAGVGVAGSKYPYSVLRSCWCWLCFVCGQGKVCLWPAREHSLWTGQPELGSARAAWFSWRCVFLCTNQYG